MSIFDVAGATLVIVENIYPYQTAEIELKSYGGTGCNSPPQFL